MSVTPVSVKVAVRDMFVALGLNPDMAESYREMVEAEVYAHLGQYIRCCNENGQELRRFGESDGGWYAEEEAALRASDRL